VILADGESGEHNGTPIFENGGVLRIEPDGENVPTIWYSPAYWQEIVELKSYHPLKGDYRP
jgi:hypothetical protein